MTEGFTMRLSSVPLQGRFVRLDPYDDALMTELKTALDVDPEAWSVLASSGQGEHFDGWWNSALSLIGQGKQVSYAVRRVADGAIIGTTAYLNINPRHRAVEIGGTFLRPEARAGAVNPEMKLLMLDHAFAAGAIRVELITDVRNTRSQAAIRKLGARPEGVLRRHRVTWTGHIRDTALFAITDQDWPRVREALAARVAGF